MAAVGHIKRGRLERALNDILASAEREGCSPKHEALVRRYRATLLPFTIRPRLDRDGLVIALMDLAARLGHPPTRRDIDKACKRGIIASLHRIRTVFGSLAKALVASGLPTLRSQRTHGRRRTK